MATGQLKIDLTALVANWQALAAQSGAGVETGAVVKADGYGLGAGRVAHTLAQAGARTFFVAAAEEGAVLRAMLGAGPKICVFSGHMAGDTDMIKNHGLEPMLNSGAQVKRHLDTLPGHPFGIQLDSGMNRLGLEPADWAELSPKVLAAGPELLMSHLACADDPAHPMNARQLKVFREMTDDAGVPRSFAATGGILMGPEYHFDLTRPGVGMYGGMPFADAQPVATLSLPVIQIRDVAPGESVGYSATWVAERPARIATVAAGYADGLIRAMGATGGLYHAGTRCPIAGRVSMDMIGVDVTGLDETPEALDILCPDQGVDALADAAGTIGYEILTSLGQRYACSYVGGPV